MTLIERLRDMGDRKNRHNYQTGEYWNAVEEAADQLEAERDAAKGIVKAATVVSKGYKKWISIPDREKMPANVVLNMFAEECEKALAAYKARTEGK